MYEAPEIEPMVVFIDWNAFCCTDFSFSVETETMYSSSRVAGTQMRTGETISITVTASNDDHFDEIIDTVESIHSPNFVLFITDGIEYYNEDISRLAITRETRAFDQSTDMSMQKIEIDIA